jgi:peptidoglycan/LPS O-acetylase OafA/YrhL
LSRQEFAKRMVKSLAIATSLIFLSLLAGMAGYHFLEDLPWIDAFMNAAMILGGMGPVAPIQTFGGKLFAGFYALYSGLVVIVAAGVIIAPVVHRMLHKFHSQTDEKE